MDGTGILVGGKEFVTSSPSFFLKKLNNPLRFLVIKPASPAGPPNRHERLKAKAIARKKVGQHG